MTFLISVTYEERIHMVSKFCRMHLKELFNKINIFEILIAELSLNIQTSGYRNEEMIQDVLIIFKNNRE